MMNFNMFVIIPRKEVVTKQTEGYSQQQQEEEEEILVFQVSENITTVLYISPYIHLKIISLESFNDHIFGIIQ